MDSLIVGGGIGGLTLALAVCQWSIRSGQNTVSLFPSTVAETP
jgi:hypothetical protein